MRRVHSSLALALALAAGCTDPIAPGPRLDATIAGAREDVEQVYVADHLTGDNEVPVRVTDAQGQSTFKLSADGTELSYRLIVANIENVVQAHIHMGAATCACPIVAFLYGPVSAGGGRIQGVLATGVITAADLRGPLAGKTIADLMGEIEAGNAYVNVHTSNGITGSPLQPGNFPGGEVRGQFGHGSGMH